MVAATYEQERQRVRELARRVGARLHDRRHLERGGEPARGDDRQPAGVLDRRDQHGQRDRVRDPRGRQGGRVAAGRAALDGQHVGSRISRGPGFCRVRDRLDDDGSAGAQGVGDPAGRDPEREAHHGHWILAQQVDLGVPVVVVLRGIARQFHSKALSQRLQRIGVAAVLSGVDGNRVGSEQVDPEGRGGFADLGDLLAELPGGLVSASQEAHASGLRGRRHERGGCRAARHGRGQDGPDHAEGGQGRCA
jgi:hypothetical protein